MKYAIKIIYRVIQEKQTEPVAKTDNCHTDKQTDRQHTHVQGKYFI